jgi:hypothetical protein
MSSFLIGTSAESTADPNLLQQAGIQWIRVNFPFPYLQQFGGELNPEYVRAREEAQRWAARGFQIMGTTPLIGIGTYQPTPTGGLEMVWNDWLPAAMGRPNSEQLLRDYRAVCAFLADDLKSEVHAWQVGNEMNQVQFAGPQKPRAACDLLIQGGLGLKDADPGAIVGWNSCLPVMSYYFYGRLHTHPLNPFDYVGIDAYYGTWDPGAPQDWEGKIVELYELTGARVLVNEWGYASRGALQSAEELRQDAPNCTFKKWRYAWDGGHSPQAQAEFVALALAAMQRQRHLLMGQFFYRWEDQATCWQCGEPDCPVETAWGLVDVNNQPKPAFYAFRDGVKALLAG